MGAKRSDNIFGQRLKELREDAGLSMLQLAKAVGVSDAAICKWENGLAEPKITYLVRLSEYFDCTIDYITGKESDYAVAQPKATVKTADGVTVAPFSRPANSPHMQETATHISPEDRKLLQSIKKLTPERRALLKETVSAWNNVAVTEKPDKKPN